MNINENHTQQGTHKRRKNEMESELEALLRYEQQRKLGRAILATIGLVLLAIPMAFWHWQIAFVFLALSALIAAIPNKKDEQQ
jgi:uncharacterized membrane protein